MAISNQFKDAELPSDHDLVIKMALEIKKVNQRMLLRELKQILEENLFQNFVNIIRENGEVRYTLADGTELSGGDNYGSASCPEFVRYLVRGAQQVGVGLSGAATTGYSMSSFFDDDGVYKEFLKRDPRIGGISDPYLYATRHQIDKLMQDLVNNDPIDRSYILGVIVAHLERLVDCEPQRTMILRTASCVSPFDYSKDSEFMCLQAAVNVVVIWLVLNFKSVEVNSRFREWWNRDAEFLKSRSDIYDFVSLVGRCLLEVPFYDMVSLLMAAFIAPFYQYRHSSIFGLFKNPERGELFTYAGSSMKESGIEFIRVREFTEWLPRQAFIRLVPTLKVVKSENPKVNKL